MVATFEQLYLRSRRVFIMENYAVFFFYPVVIVDGVKKFEAGFHLFELLTWLEDEPTMCSWST